MKLGRCEARGLNQDDAPGTLTCLIGQDGAHWQVRNFANSSPDLLVLSPLPPYETSASMERGSWALRPESPSSRWPAPENKYLSLTWAPVSLVLAFIVAGSWPCVQLQFLATPDGTTWAPVRPRGQARVQLLVAG